MKVPRKFVTSLLLLALLFTEACNKKKTTALPPRTLAPTIAEVLPDEIPENPETPVAESAPPPAPPPTVKTKPKKPARTTAKKSSPPVTAPVAAPAPPPPPAANNQTVANLRPPHNSAADNTPDMAIAAAVPSQQVSQQKEDTAHMVDATENALKNITRPLSDEEKAMRTQIQSYIQQSRKATTDGDFERAYNLAKKAQLLADALIKK
jgi:ElaB/YqjD/DUF883 family membrane-anchored ribosome-binding protein